MFVIHLRGSQRVMFVIHLRGVVAVVLADVLCHHLPSILNGFRRQVVAHVLENPLGCLGKLVVVVRGGGAAASTGHRPAGRSSGWRAAGSEGSSP